MRKFNWSLEIWFILSIIIFGFIIFSYPKTIIQYFLDRNERRFFISDFNLFTHIYIYNNFFIIYLIYSPFFYFMCFIWWHKYIFESIYFFYIRIIFSLVYAHMLARLLNHIDFSNISIISLITLFNSKINTIDFSYLLRHYYGLYWDFFIMICLYITRNRYLIENPKKLIYTTTGYIRKHTNQFWSVFYLSWFIRCLTYRLRRYFFCGEGFLSDRGVCRLSIVGVEIIRFTWRAHFLFARTRN